MKTDSEIKLLGLEVLRKNLGPVDTERFIALIQREKFDYTKWRENLFKGSTGEEISQKAMEYHHKLKDEGIE